MDHINTANVENQIAYLLDNAPMTCGNLKEFVLLCEAMEYLSKMRHEFTKEDAEDWVKHMNPPARWTMEQTTAVMYQRKYEHDPVEFYVVMNMLVSDYGKTMAKYGADKPEVWADMANDFISDPDAVKNKVGKYFRDITQRY